MVVRAVMAVMEGLAQCTVEVATEARQVVARAVVQEAATVSAREVVSAAGGWWRRRRERWRKEAAVSVDSRHCALRELRLQATPRE